jgi:RND family efflux transporter MFP subunit
MNSVLRRTDWKITMNRRLVWMLGAAGFGILAGCGREPPAVAPPLPAVTVAVPHEESVTDYEEFTGNTEAVSKVDIRARVSGYLVRVNFKDGDDTIKEGDLLYEIDDRPFKADLDQANGNVERLEAERKLLAIQVDRYRKLATKGAGSQQDLDQYLAQQAENVGALKVAQAQVDRAKLNLGFTRVTAPISGKIGRTLLTAGNLVNADNTLLTTLVSIDPMYAYFNVEEATVLEVRRLIREGVIKPASVQEVEVRMGLADDVKREFPIRGTLDFVNYTVNRETGTVLLRGVFKNPYSRKKPPLLMPGYFVRVRLDEGLPRRLPAGQTGNALSRSAGDRRRDQTPRARRGQRFAAHPAGRRGQGPRGQDE